MIRRTPERAAGDGDVGGGDADLAQVRTRLRAMRRKVRAQRERITRLRSRLESKDAALVRARDELAILRASSLELFTEHEIPAAARKVIDGVRAEKLTYLDPGPLDCLVRCVLEADAAGREGLVIEAGTALGGSAIAMAAAKDPARPMKVYDVFGMIPPPSDKDGDDVIRRYESIAAGESKGLQGETYYGYREDLLGEVTGSFARHGVAIEDHNVELVQGLFQDTIVGDEPVALAHVDGDWYDSTMTCLTRLVPRLVPGGRIVIDDYFMWSGCRQAVDDFVAEHPELRVEMRAKVHLVRPEVPPR